MKKKTSAITTAALAILAAGGGGGDSGSVLLHCSGIGVVPLPVSIIYVRFAPGSVRGTHGVPRALQTDNELEAPQRIGRQTADAINVGVEVC